MKHDLFSYATFGKRRGFEVFQQTGFVFDSAAIEDLFLEFLQLDLDKIGLQRQQDLFSSWRFQYAGRYYTFFALFRFAPDTSARPGFYGTAVAFCDCYSQDLDGLIEIMNQLAVVAGHYVQDQDKSIPALPDLKIIPHRFAFQAPNEKAFPVYLDFRPSVRHFFELTLSDTLAPAESPVFFCDDLQLLDHIDHKQVLLQTYQEAMVVRLEELKHKKDDLQESVGLLYRDKNQAIKENQALETERIELEAEIEKLRTRHATLQRDLKELTNQQLECQKETVQVKQQLNKKLQQLETIGKEVDRFKSLQKILLTENKQYRKDRETAAIRLKEQKKLISEQQDNIVAYQQQEAQLRKSVTLLRSELSSLKKSHNRLQQQVEKSSSSTRSKVSKVNS